MKRVLKLFTAGALIAISTNLFAAESLSVLLQKAIYAEETEGNLESAIKLYEQIAADAATRSSSIRYGFV